MSESVEDEQPVMRVELPRDRTWGIRRGGRLGLTVTTDVKAQGATDHLAAMTAGSVFAILGVLTVEGALSQAVLWFGAFWTGAAVERLRWYRSGEREDNGGEDE